LVVEAEKEEVLRDGVLRCKGKKGDARRRETHILWGWNGAAGSVVEVCAFI